MANDELIAALRDADAVKFGEFELSHGGTSNYYVDKYVFETNPACLDLIAGAFAERIAEWDTDATLAGVALGAVPLVAVTSVETDIPYVIARKQAKEYGTGNRIEGDLPTARKSSSSKTSRRPVRARSTPPRRSARPALSSITCSSSSTARRGPARTSPTTTSNSRRS